MKKEEKIIFCIKCGTRLSKDERFCHKCGNEVYDESMEKNSGNNFKGKTKKCQYCKSEIDASAKVCPVCKRNIYSPGQLLFVAILIMVMFFLFFKGISSLFGDIFKEENIVSNGEIELNTIYQEYVDNEVRAKEKYENNYYTFNGEIKDFSSDILDKPIVYINFDCDKGTCEAVVYFRKSESNKISNLNKGDNIRFIGKVDDEGIFTDLYIKDAILN